MRLILRWVQHFHTAIYYWLVLIRGDCIKIYLSKYWIAGHISLVCVEVAVVVATVVFCIEYRDADIIMIIGSLVYIGSASYVQSKTICILDYVEVSNNQFTQYSFSGKRKRAVNSDEPIYYQIVPLFEGFFLRADFIVLSNQEFLPYRNGSVIGTVYKEVMAKGNQIIMPYNQKSRPLLHLRDWHKVCFYWFVLFKQVPLFNYKIVRKQSN